MISSLFLHLIVVAATFAISPFELTGSTDMPQVIQINAISMPQYKPAELEAEPEPVPTAPVPPPVEPEPEQIPIDDPTTKPAAEIEKQPEVVKPPKEEPKPPKNDTPPVKETDPGDGDQTGTGATEVDVPSGSSISGVSIDNASFNYPYWFTLTWGKLNQNFRIPITIDGLVTCEVYFQVIKSGKMIESRVKKPSGIPAFDDACLAALQRSTPFAPLPKEFIDEIIGITVTFTN